MRATVREWQEGLLQRLQDRQISLALSLRKSRDRRRANVQTIYDFVSPFQVYPAKPVVVPDRVQARPKMRKGRWPRSLYTARRYQPIPPIRTAYMVRKKKIRKWCRAAVQARKQAKVRLPLRKRLMLFVTRRLWLWLFRRWHR